MMDAERGGVGRADEVEVVRSEEELVVARARRPVERVRIKRVVIEEEIMVPVRVRREELRLEREQIPDGQALSGHPGDPGDADEVVADWVLHSEEPEVSLRLVAREHVRVWREIVTGEPATVSEELRREEVEVEGDQPEHRSS